jgi:hypothetical protein
LRRAAAMQFETKRSEVQSSVSLCAGQAKSEVEFERGRRRLALNSCRSGLLSIAQQSGAHTLERQVR